MPGLHETGPQAHGPIKGRGHGRCRMIAVPAHEPAVPVQQVNNERGTAIPEGSGQNMQGNGRGRRRETCGCGNSFGFGGNRRFR